jgi:hypothetical protein
MSVNIKQLDGSLKKIAGNTIILDATASEIREGTFSIQCQGDSGANTTITFETPMPDTDYVVIFESNSPTPGEIGFRSKTTTGFGLYVLGGREDTTTYTFTGKYYAFRLVKLEGYTALQNKVNNPDSAPTENSTNLVTSGGVYDAIKNASSVFIGTSSEWESETSKTDYQVAILTDKPNVNAVDSTDGSTTVVANKNLVFKGTLDEWEALTTAEKKAYDEALITNDMDTGEVVNAVTDGDMRAVTSNAVYDTINGIETSTVTLTLGSGTNATMTLYLYKSGHIVNGIASAQSDPSGISIIQSDWVSIGTLPTGFRPQKRMFVPLIHANSRNVECMVQIAPTGAVSLYKYTEGNLGWERAINFSFITN